MSSIVNSVNSSWIPDLHQYLYTTTLWCHLLCSSNIVRQITSLDNIGKIEVQSAVNEHNVSLMLWVETMVASMSSFCAQGG